MWFCDSGIYALYYILLVFNYFQIRYLIKVNRQHIGQLDISNSSILFCTE